MSDDLTAHDGSVGQNSPDESGFVHDTKRQPWGMEDTAQNLPPEILDKAILNHADQTLSPEQSKTFKERYYAMLKDTADDIVEQPQKPSCLTKIFKWFF